MGCCGCGLYGSTITAGVLGIIQSLIYFTVSLIVTIIQFSFARYYVVSYWKDNQNSQKYIDFIGMLRINTAMKMMGIVTILFNLLWLASSIALLVSNAKRKLNAKGVFQWALITTIMTICEMVFTLYFISLAMDHQSYGGFFFDLASISRGYGVLFGWSFNIPLTIFVYKRYQEICNINLEGTRSTHTFAVPFNSQPGGSVYPQHELQQRQDTMVPLVYVTQQHPQWTTGPCNPNNSPQGVQAPPHVYPNTSYDQSHDNHQIPMVKTQA